MKNTRNKSFWTSLFAFFLIASLVLSACSEAEEEGMARVRNSGQTLPEVVNAPAAAPVSIPPAAVSGFTPQTRMGYTVGDQWEPAIAADRYGHVYILYPQYSGVPGCSTCYSPTMILLISSDHGVTWSAPVIIYPAGQTTGQWDAQIVVDPVDGQTVYASWLQNGKSDIAIAKSIDYGATWSVVIADSTKAGTDKPILVVHGQDIFVAYNHTQTVYVSSSHDGGATFTAVKINTNAKFGWSLAGGGAIGSDGSIYFSWAGYTQNGGAKGPVNLYVSKSANGGQTWTSTQIDTSGAPPDCSAFLCGWAFLGAQMTMTADTSGNLYLLWNAGSVAKGPERIYFAKSTNNGQTWSAKVDVSTAPAGTSHAFPAIVATGNGDVRIAWMDTRAGTLWNMYYRSSTNGGGTWSTETKLSTYVAGYSYIFANGFSFPFGDYFEMDIDENGTTHVVWGEALNYDTPGSIWYVQGK
jgi:hypothetical protein